MAAQTTASAPSAYITEVPGRFAPFILVDKRNIANVTTSSATQAQLAYLPRASSASNDFQVPLTAITEIGSNFNVGQIDDIPENKVSITCYDVGTTALSLITGKNAPASSTTTYGFNDLNVANVDIIRQYADPNGNVFYSEFMGSHVVEEYGMSLKAKSQATENFSLTGFNTAGFRGFFQTKAYIVQAADVTGNSFSLSSLLGTNEGVVAIPTPTGPASYWQQIGCYNFLKIERYRASTGFVRVRETTGAVSLGYCKYTAPNLAFAAGDLVAGDVFLLTYMTYATNVNALSTLSGTTVAAYQAAYNYLPAGQQPTYSYGSVPSFTVDTSDPIAVPTRLAGLSIAAAGISRGTAADMKMSLKRDRAEGTAIRKVSTGRRMHRT
jgi:hypothetical protein